MSTLQNVEGPRWRSGPQICNVTNLPAFENVKAAKAFIDSLPAISADRFFDCPHCLGVHVETHDRPPVGWSSGSSTRAQTRSVPAHIQARNAVFSARRNRHA